MKRRRLCDIGFMKHVNHMASCRDGVGAGVGTGVFAVGTVGTVKYKSHIIE